LRRFGKTGRQKEIDELDFQLSILLLKEYNHEQIVDTTDNPMSTKYYKTLLRKGLLFQRYNRIMQGLQDL
jgi:hypothetical protein